MNDSRLWWNQYDPAWADPQCDVSYHHPNRDWEQDSEPCDCLAPYNQIPDGKYRVFDRGWVVVQEGDRRGDSFIPPPKVDGEKVLRWS